MDRLIFAGLYRLVPSILNALTIVKPETVVRWHRAGFKLYWRWKSRRRGGRPTVSLEIRRIIGEMSIANPLWGAPRIHGELLKLGINIGQTSVAKYMAMQRGPPSQGWKTFLRNHADGIAAMDLFVVPTISFRLLYGLLIMGHGRRQILWFGVTAHPTAEWIANQITEACGWEQTPRYLIRDRDRTYGEVFIRRLRSMSIRDRPTSPRSPRPLQLVLLPDFLVIKDVYRLFVERLQLRNHVFGVHNKKPQTGDHGPSAPRLTGRYVLLFEPLENLTPVRFLKKLRVGLDDTENAMLKIRQLLGALHRHTAKPLI